MNKNAGLNLVAADVAQLVEQGFRKAQVDSSTLSVGSINVALGLKIRQD